MRRTAYGGVGCALTAGIALACAWVIYIAAAVAVAVTRWAFGALGWP